jgi:diguanylate cyclase (GGDEF)-like protein
VITRKRMAHFGDSEFLVAIVSDVTDHRRAEAANRFLAFHDPLTGLPNRTMLKERIEQALALDFERCALLYIDLDRFKEVNDTHGHPVGDELIRDFADRLRGVVRSCDTVARLGGDEFAILLVDTKGEVDVDELCERTLNAASRAFNLTGIHVSVGASIGFAFAEGGIDQVELQRRADVALYQAKNDGRGCSRTYTAELDVNIRRRQRMERDLRTALAAGTGLEVHYQPIACLTSGQIVGFEALARWQHPELGLIMPDVFIPIAEACGLIVELGDWVLGQACSDACLWQPSMWLSVNVSPVQFAYGDLAATVDRIVSQTDFDPSRLELEITEGVLIEDPAGAIALLNRIRALGVQIVLDDFGIGFSSLNYFRQFPFDKVKIDRSFIADMMVSSHARSIVEAVISLARGLGVQIVAEGVETEDQLALLSAQGCDQAQGHFISSPSPISQFAGSVLPAFKAGRSARAA